MTYSHAKIQGQWRVGSNGNKWTVKWMEAITLPSLLIDNKPLPEQLTLLNWSAAVYFPAATPIARCHVCVLHPTNKKHKQTGNNIDTLCRSMQPSSCRTLLSQKIYTAVSQLSDKWHILFLPLIVFHCCQQVSDFLM